MNILFVNPPFKAEYGKFSREARSPMITNSGVIYYPLWLLYAAGVCEQEGHNIYFLDAPAKRMTHEESFKWIEEKQTQFDLIVIDTSTPSIYNDVKFGGDLKDKYKNTEALINNQIDLIVNGKLTQNYYKQTKIDIINEKIRLLYVGITRAKEMLIMMGSSYKSEEESKNTKKKQEPCLYLKILNQLIKEKREMNK